MEYDIFRSELAIKHPAHGHALWVPSPGSLYPPVEVGDVGFIHEGQFHHLFNVLLPEDHSSHSNFGVPEHHKPLEVKVPRHINSATLGPNDFCSKEVTVVSGGLEIFAAGPEPAQVTFSCSRKQGAILSLPVPAQRENTVARGDFSKCILKNIDVWFAFARELGLGVSRMEDIILVTGRDLARSSTNVVFSESLGSEQVSLAVRVRSNDNVEWLFSREDVQGVALNRGPSGQHLPQDQCIFIRGFRVTRFLKILPPRLRGAAEPSQGPGEGASEPGSDKQLISTPPDTEYQDPLHTLLDYLRTQAPDNDMALVHDDDLRDIDVASLETLRPEAVLDHLQNSRPEIWSTQYDGFPASEGGSEAELRITKVATLSKYEFEVSTNHPTGRSANAPPSSSSRLPQSSTLQGGMNTVSLLVDGYLSQCFQQQLAHQYFLCLLKCNRVPPSTLMGLARSESLLFIVPSVPRHIPFQFPGEYRWVLDRSVLPLGTVVPQTMWSPPSVTDRRQHVEETELQMPIFFDCSDGRLGLSLDDAVAGRFRNLLRAQQIAPLGNKSTIHIRIGWPGYVEFERQVQIRDETIQRNPVTIYRFALHVARSVDAFLRACQPLPALRPELNRWRIGQGSIQRNDLMIIGAVHVSAGSWMPILQLNRYLL